MKSREKTVSTTKSTAESTSRPWTPAMEPRRAVSDAVTACGSKQFFLFFKKLCFSTFFKNKVF